MFLLIGRRLPDESGKWFLMENYVAGMRYRCKNCGSSWVASPGVIDISHQCNPNISKVYPYITQKEWEENGRKEVK